MIELNRLFLAFIVSLTGSAGAYAADAVSPVAPEMHKVEAGDWTFAASPYFWAAGLSGNVAQFGLPATIQIDQDFGDILKNLDFAAMATGEARNDRFSIFGDVMYTKISTGSGTPRGIIADSIDVSSQTFVGLLGAGYSVLKSDDGYLDVVAGARLWDTRTEISVHGGPFNGRDVSDGRTWVDGLAGIRGRYNFDDKFYATGWGLIGAGQANIDWDVAAGLGYLFNSKWSAVAGYRALGVNYDRDGFVFDVVQQGPILGLVVRF